MVASEMAANAVRAGAGSFRLRAWREDGAVMVEVGDDGPGFQAVFTDDGGTVVRCRVSV